MLCGLINKKHMYISVFIHTTMAAGIINDLLRFIYIVTEKSKSVFSHISFTE